MNLGFTGFGCHSELEAHRSLYDGGVYDEQVWQKDDDGRVVFGTHEVSHEERAAQSAPWAADLAVLPRRLYYVDYIGIHLFILI